MRRIRIILVSVGLLGITLSGTTPAIAQSQPLLGCVKPGTGLLRILQPGESCKANETPLGFDDLPLLVALRNEVVSLRTRVSELEQCLAEKYICELPD